MAARPFRFGLNLIPNGSREQLQEVCRIAEDTGYDVITVSDYITLDLPPAGIKAWSTRPPLLTLAAAAQATRRVQLGSYALNASLYRPALVAREVNALQDISDGRLEVGIGAGYLKADFEAADVPWGNASERVGRAERLVDGLRAMAADPVPPVLLGTSTSELMLDLAARKADIVSLTGAESKTEFSRARLLSSERIATQCKAARATAAGREADVELNVLVHAVHLADSARADPPEFPNVEQPSTDELRRLPGILTGTPRSIAEDLHRYREEYGISYYTIRVPHMADFAAVISAVR